MATTNDLKNGMTLNLDGQLWNVIEFQHVKPGKGGSAAKQRLHRLNQNTLELAVFFQPLEQWLYAI